MNSPRVTMFDIAKRLGVSHTTVSLALRNHRDVSAKRREEIQRVAEEMGYQRDPFLAGLAAYRKQTGGTGFQGTLAWLNHWDPPERLREFGEFNAYWEGAAKAAKSLGYKLDEVLWPLDCPAKRVEKILLARGVQGVLIPPQPCVPDWGDFDWSKFSLIRFGTSVPSPDSNLVTSDHFRAVIMATTRIHEYGYRRIGFVTDKDYNYFRGGNYYGGFVWAQKLLELAPPLPPLLMNAERFRNKPEKELPVLNRWLARHKPDAILTTEPYIPDATRKLGHRIPHDIAVAGTTVRDIPVDAGIDQHAEGIGRIAVEMLVKQIHVNERGEPPDPCRILIESTWQDGKSLPRRNAG